MTDRLDTPSGAPGDLGDTASDATITESDVGHPDGDLRVTTTPDADAIPDGDDARQAERAEPSLATRTVRRVFRRPGAWFRRPWTDERIIRFAFTAVALGITTYVMTNVVHLSILPSRDLVFDDTTPTGGDFGAHNWGPAYLRDHLLGSFRLNGWSMDWYAGFPAYRFYMVLPALGVVLVDTVLPYGIALKLVSVLGLITLPAACWAFGRLASFRYPVPELFAFAGLAFALDESFSIYGGNLKSTMAGEFSFSIALSIGMVGLGVLANGLRTGRYRVWASVLIAAACVSHGVVMVAIVIPAAIVWCLIWLDRTRFRYAWTVGLTSVLLMSWWVLPFVWDHEYQTDMKYGELTNWWEMYFPLSVPLDIIISTLAVLGFVFAIVRRNLDGAALGVTGLVLFAFVYVAKDSLPVLGLLWNPRVLPGFYLVRYLLMMYGAYHLLALLWNSIRDRRANAEPSAAEATGLAVVPALVAVIVLGWVFQELPGGSMEVKTEGEAAVYTWGPFSAPQREDATADAQGDGWARYNFRGYEGRDDPAQGIAYYTEYRNVVTTMQGLGDDPNHGCGRALWENNEDNGQYGTTMALMLLPFWTDGCIGSMEGLFFEASGTTPYHFLTTAAMSEQSSNPVRELRYTDNDAAVGVQHLQDLGVKYTMVRTDAAKAEAAAQPELTLVAQSAPWEIYEVADSDVVVGLDYQPVVVDDRLGDGAGTSDARERYLEIGTSWFQQPDEWAAMPAADGPDEWQRIDVQPDLTRRVSEGEPGGPDVDIVVPAEPIEQVPLPEVAVSNVDIGDDSLAFDVDQVGVPVLVKVSYFPNWNADGADGPYRIGPNQMVVVPTATHVELSYGRTPVDYASMLLTLVGVGLCFWWRREGDIEHAGPTPTFRTRTTDAPLGDDTPTRVTGAAREPDAGLDGPDTLDDGEAMPVRAAPGDEWEPPTDHAGAVDIADPPADPDAAWRGRDVTGGTPDGAGDR